jgi:hypothetical protein
MQDFIGVVALWCIVSQVTRCVVARIAIVMTAVIPVRAWTYEGGGY